jgi:DNA replication and repair protein RecF
MYLEKLSILNFKNYTESEIEFCDKINCFVGDNGEGKTNLLDAIHYLSFCKSYFNNIDSQNILHEAAFFTITGAYRRKGDEAEVVQCIQKRNQRKVFKINKKEYERLSEHIGLIPLVMISPSDSNMIYEGSEERRKYIDSVISQFDKLYLQDLISYNKALEQRNRLFKVFAEKRIFEYSSLELWDEQLMKYGTKIFSKREEFVEKLTPIFREHYNFITENKEDMELVYDSQLKGQDFRTLLEASIDRDRALLYTTLGIHKDDLLFNIGGRPIRKFGSQGQQKSFLIALKLAQYDYTKKIKGYKPILLFDDIFDKLDDARVGKLISQVSGNSFGQIFITETHKDRILRIFDNTGVKTRIYEVKKGRTNQLTINN